MKELTDELTALLNTSSTASGMHCVFKINNNNLMMLLLTHSDQYGSGTDLLLAAGNIGRAMAGFVNTVDGLVHYNVCCPCTEVCILWLIHLLNTHTQDEPEL